jgi:uncharacterized protein YjbI with pentapeptide repeats
MNQEHVDKLRAVSKASFNAWRQANPNVTVDLSEADMRGANLRGPMWQYQLRH